jgi:hypothetical protein
VPLLERCRQQGFHHRELGRQRSSSEDNDFGFVVTTAAACPASSPGQRTPCPVRTHAGFTACRPPEGGRRAVAHDCGVLALRNRHLLIRGSLRGEVVSHSDDPSLPCSLRLSVSSSSRLCVRPIPACYPTCQASPLPVFISGPPPTIRSGSARTVLLHSRPLQNQPRRLILAGPLLNGLDLSVECSS